MRMGRLIIAVAAACLASASAAAPPGDDSVTPEQTREWAAEAARLALVEAKSYEIHLGGPDGPRIELVEQPALKWSNTYEATVFGSVHVWTRDGCPSAIACMYKFYTSKTEFDGEFHSLASDPLTALKHGQVVWSPIEPGIRYSPVPEAKAPVSSAAGRLSQMRAIARDFSTELTTIAKTRHNLRLLPQPLFRYADSGNVADGAVFAFARATDPDVILLLEARTDGENPRWEYALARMHVGALKASYRDVEVWSVDELAHPYARPHGPYTTFQNLPEPEAAPAAGSTR